MANAENAATNTTIEAETEAEITAKLQEARNDIMVVLGSNFLGTLSAIILTIIVLLPLFYFLLVKFLRIPKAHELIG